jgi:FAD synthetase
MQRTKGSINVAEERVDNILDYVAAYLEDAKYYKAQKKLETSLTSVAYCEGLLDALRLLGAVKFEWPAKTERKK